MHNETSHSKAFELLQESVTFLQNKLHSKDEIKNSSSSIRHCSEKKDIKHHG